MAKNDDMGEFLQDKDEMMRVVQKSLAEQNFESPKEMEAFLAEQFTGKKIDDIIEQNRQFPSTPEDRALVEIRGIDGWNDDQKTIHRAAKRALGIDPDCVEAHVLFGDSADSPKHAIPFYKDAVAAGRRKFKDLIDGCRGNPREGMGVWGFVEARPFMRAMQSLSECYFMAKEMDSAIEIEQEMLDINAGDNQGIREMLLLHYMLAGRFAEAEALVEFYEGDVSAAMRLTDPLLSFISTLDQIEDPEQLIEVDRIGIGAVEAWDAKDHEVAAENRAAFFEKLGPKFFVRTKADFSDDSKSYLS